MEEWEKICLSDFLPLGYLEGERATSAIRLVSLVVTVSITSLWWSSHSGGKLRLFFTHWFSGLMHLLFETILEQLVLNCWLRAGMLDLFKSLRFVVNVSANMIAVTNVAICINLALIVYGHRSVSSVRGLSSFRLMLGFLVASAAVAAISIPFGDLWLVSGVTIYLAGNTPGRQRLLISSYVSIEAVSSAVMILIIVLLLIFRRPELCQVWTVHRRIKVHFALTAIALIVNMMVAAAGVFLVIDGEPVWLVLASWCLRYVHIALDTIVLYSALKVPPIHLELEGGEVKDGCGMHVVEGDRVSPTQHPRDVPIAGTRRGVVTSI